MNSPPASVSQNERKPPNSAAASAGTTSRASDSTCSVVPDDLARQVRLRNGDEEDVALGEGQFPSPLHGARIVPTGGELVMAAEPPVGIVAVEEKFGQTGEIDAVHGETSPSTGLAGEQRDIRISF